PGIGDRLEHMLGPQHADLAWLRPRSVDLGDALLVLPDDASGESMHTRGHAVGLLQHLDLMRTTLEPEQPGWVCALEGVDVSDRFDVVSDSRIELIGFLGEFRADVAKQGRVGRRSRCGRAARWGCGGAEPLRAGFLLVQK